MKRATVNVKMQSPIFLLLGLVGAVLFPELVLAGNSTVVPQSQVMDEAVQSGEKSSSASNTAAPPIASPDQLKPAMFPYNMARARMGTKIRVFGTEPTPIYSIDLTGQVQDENQSEHALLTDDMTVAYPLKEHVIALQFTLPYATEVNRFNFFNFGGAGTVQLYASAKAPDRQGKADWEPLGPLIEFDASGFYNQEFSPALKRFFKVEFTRKREGRVGAFGLFGDLYPGRIDQVTTFRVPKDQVPPHQIITNNLASVYNGAEVVYVSSNKVNGYDHNPLETRLKIDDDVTTYYEFSPEDKQPTGVIDLGDTRPLRRISWLFQSVAGQFDIYLSNRLTDAFLTEQVRGNGRRVVGLTEDFFRENVPFHSVRIADTNDGRLAFNFQNTWARYLVFRFTPDVLTASLAPISALRLNSFHVFGNYDPLGNSPPDVPERQNFPLFPLTPAPAPPPLSP